MTRYIYICAFLLCLFALRPAAAQDILDVEVIRSKGGIEAWLVEDKTVPVLSISFSFDGGLALDPEDKPGVGRMVSILLDEGAGDMDAQAFQEKAAVNAISISFTAGRDAFQGQLKTLKANKDVAFDLLALALTKPLFEAEAIERMRNANISQIKDDMNDPAWLSARAFNGMVFEGSYYARPGYGHLASMETITRNDLTAFVKKQFARDVLKVAIAGDISKEEARLALDKIFGALPEKAAPAPDDTVALKHGGKTILLPLDTPQTFISVGSAGIPRKDKDWHAAAVMNYILGGGGFESRLMEEIRKKRGLTYGVYSSLVNMKNADVIQAKMSVGNAKTAEAIALLKQEWAKMAAYGPTEEELKDAKSYMTGSVLVELTSTGEIASTLNGLQQEDLPPGYINDYSSKINAVTEEDVRRAAARILKTDDLAVILVGKPEDVSADIMLDRAPGMATPKEK